MQVLSDSIISEADGLLIVKDSLIDLCNFKNKTFAKIVEVKDTIITMQEGIILNDKKHIKNINTKVKMWKALTISLGTLITYLLIVK